MKTSNRLLVFGFLAVGFCPVAQGDAVPLIPDIAPISEAAISAPLLVERIRKGEITTEAAWQKGELNRESLLFLLNQPSGYLGEQNLLDRAGLVKPFVETLLREVPQMSEQLVEKPQVLPAGARFRVAAYWFQKRDAQTTAQAVPLLQSLVQEGAAEAKIGKAWPWFYEPSVTLLAETLEKAGERRAAIALLDEGLLLTKNPVYQADWTLMQAGMHRVLGDEEKSRALYARVAAFGKAWFSGVAVWEQADALINAGQTEQGQRLLKTTLELANKAELDAEEKKAHVPLWALLAWSHYQQGQWQEAKAAARRALALFETLPPAAISNGVGAQAQWARRMSEWSEKFSQAALWHEPQTLQTQVAAAGKQTDRQTLTLRFSLFTHPALVPGDTPLKIVANNPLITIKPLPVVRGDKQLYTRRSYLVEVGPHDFKEPVTARLTIGCQECGEPRVLEVKVEQAAEKIVKDR